MSQRTKGIYSLTQIPGFYSKLQGLLGGDRSRRAIVSEYIRPLPQQSVLDIGCGSASMLPYLGDVNYVGVDVNHQHIAAAASRFNKNAQFFCGDVHAIPELKAAQFDIILCAGLLHHLNDQDVKRLLLFSGEHLVNSGKLVTIDAAFTSDQHIIARWFAKADSGQQVRTPDHYRRLSDEVFSFTELSVRHDLLRVPYTHCIQQMRTHGASFF